MSIWAQSYRNSQFHDAHDLEILNNTLRTFASPEPDPDSHTAAKTKHLRKLKDELPILHVNTNFASPSLIRSRDTLRPRKGSQSNHLAQAHNKLTKVFDSRRNDSELTRPGAHAVKFNIDPTHHCHHESEKDDVISDLDHEGLRIKKPKQLRRASAPSHGMAFAYFSASSTTSIHYFGRNSSESSQDVHNKQNFTVPSVNIEHHDHSDEINDDSNMTTTSPVTSTSSAISSCNVPSLSPCSSASSLSSSIDTLSSTVQQPYPPPPGKVQFSFGSFLSQPVHTPCPIRSKSISTEIPYTSQASSLPNMVSGASYDHIPWSPAKDFLANLAQSTMAIPMPDDEGQQVGEYIIGKVIGRGGFSTVKEAIRMDDYSSLEKAAVKIVKSDQESDYNDRVQSLLQREITIWKKLLHPNIVPMYSVIDDKYATYVFSEYCPGGNLLQYVKRRGGGGGLDEHEVRDILLEIAEAIRYMHNDMRLVHKDIKLDNILQDREGRWKLCDFGLTEFQNDANGFGELSSCDDVAGGSLAYCPPEQIRSKVPLKVPSVDIWSLGVVMYAMVTGQLPFMDEFEPRMQHKILNGRYDETPLHDAGVSDELRDLLKGMFRTNPTHRLSITQVLEHSWCRR